MTPSQLYRTLEAAPKSSTPPGKHVAVLAGGEWFKGMAQISQADTSMLILTPDEETRPLYIDATHVVAIRIL